MTRRCSYCNQNGHNSSTCPNRGVKLFGVRLTEGSIRKTSSMGNLSHQSSSGLSGIGELGSNNPGSPGDGHDHGIGDGYASEDFVPGSSSSRKRKKGSPWTEEEHKMFLLGQKRSTNILLQKYLKSSHPENDKGGNVFTESHLKKALRVVGENVHVPDLLLVYGPVRSHLGFHAWRLRYTEIVHMGSLKYMRYGSLLKAIHKFIGVRQNYGA